MISCHAYIFWFYIHVISVQFPENPILHVLHWGGSIFSRHSRGTQRHLSEAKGFENFQIFKLQVLSDFGNSEVCTSILQRCSATPGHLVPVPHVAYISVGFKTIPLEIACFYSDADFSMLRLQYLSSQGDISVRQALVDRDFVLGTNIYQPWFSAANTCNVTMFTTLMRTCTLFVQTFRRHGGRAHLLCRHGGSDELAQFAGGKVNSCWL